MSELNKLLPENLSTYLTQIFKNTKISDPLLQNDANLNQCIFHTLRGSFNRCTETDNISTFGYCTTHLSTSQAKNAKKLFESFSFENTPKENTPKENTPKKESLKENSPKENSPKKEGIEEESPETEESSEEEIVLKLRKNKWGNYEDKETNLVFDPRSKAVYGLQHKNGDVYSLSPDEVAICIEKGWKYVLPEAKYERNEEEESGSE